MEDAETQNIKDVHIISFPTTIYAPVLASLSLWLQRGQRRERPERAGNKVGDFYIERVKMTGVEENWKRSRKAGEGKGPTLLGK